jgi:glutathione S-transferase
MAITLYYGSGSAYAWRVWLTLVHKDIPHEVKVLSFDAGDLRTPEFRALTPRGQVPVIVEADGHTLYESAAIVEYLEDAFPQKPLFAAEPRKRAVQRRMVREADVFAAKAIGALFSAVFTPPERRLDATIAQAFETLREELAMWEPALAGDYLTGELSVADITLYPHLAMIERLAKRVPELVPADLAGPRMTAWLARMKALPMTQRTWPPHWK